MIQSVMLGKLFNLTAAGGSASTAQASSPLASPEPVSSLESVQEDAHSRHLLYPDTQALFQQRHDQVFPLPSSPYLAPSSLASAFDYDSDIDLDMRDVRVLVMQDGLGSIPASLLYDSQQPPPAPPPTVSDRPSSISGLSHLNNFNLQDSPSRRVPTSPRKPSLGHTVRPLVIQPESPQLRHSATFDRRPSFHGRSHSRMESEAHKAYREYADEISVFSSCIFGNSELLAYRGTSTKVHILPSDTRPDLAASSIIHDGRGSLGRSSMRSSKLSQSVSSESAAMFMPPPNSSSSSVATSSLRVVDRKQVLVTRLFPVLFPTDEDIPQTPAPQASMSEEFGGAATSYPFPAFAEDDQLKKRKKAQMKQRRTPMYAIALIINLPQSPSLSTPSVSTSRSAFRGPGSYSDQDYFPSSYGSGRRVGTGMSSVPGAASGLGIDMSASEHYSTMPLSGAFSSTTDLEERIDPITQHWDIIMRTLTQMQGVVSETVSKLLKAADISSPGPYPLMPTHAPRASFSRRRSEDGGFPTKPTKTNAKLVALSPNVLMDIDCIAHEADDARVRIAVGLRALRVITGQNRWEIWREEARWIARWALSSIEQHQPLRQQLDIRPDDYFYSTVTAFLATHTDWLEPFCASRPRKGHLFLQSPKGDDIALPARTIIVSQDKSAARRLIFLLSAFLPATQALPGATRTQCPDTSMSWGALSQSPPTTFAVPVFKEESLRRKINRRAGGRRSSHSRNPSLQGPGSMAVAHRSASISAADTPAPTAHRNTGRGYHERRPSDTASIRTANLPISGNDFNTRKSSAATMTMVTSEATVPHFATLQRLDSSSFTRSGSASSAAEDDLKRALRRGDSNSSHTSNALYHQFTGPGVDLHNQSSRWGVLTGLLIGRRRESTSNPGAYGHSRNSSTSSRWDSFGRRPSLTPSSPIKPQPELVQQPPPPPPPIVAAGYDGHVPNTTASDAAFDQAPANPPGTPRMPDNAEAGDMPGRTDSSRVPGLSSGFKSPVKATVNPEDGVIDVDIQFPEYLRSFETAVSSPSSSGFLSTPGFGSGMESFEQFGRASVDSDLPANVAGWLQTYHPDFALQGIPPQEDLVVQVKESLRNEPMPAIVPEHRGMQAEGAQASERWVDVSSAVIVDTTKWTICRLRYSRLIGLKASGEVSTPNSGRGSFSPSTATTSNSAPMQETLLDERFTQEYMTSQDQDSALAEAIERVIAQGVVSGNGSGSVSGGDNAVDSSNCSSRPASVLRGRSNSEVLGPDEALVAPSQAMLAAPVAPTATLEVPRGECKTVILSALGEIVRDALRTSEAADSVAGEEHDSTSGREARSRSILQDAVKTWFEGVEAAEV